MLKIFKLLLRWNSKTIRKNSTKPSKTKALTPPPPQWASPKPGPSPSELLKTTTNATPPLLLANKPSESNPQCPTNNATKINNPNKPIANLSTKTSQWCNLSLQKTNHTSTTKPLAPLTPKATFRPFKTISQDSKASTTQHCIIGFQTIQAITWEQTIWAFRKWKKMHGKDQWVV